MKRILTVSAILALTLIMAMSAFAAENDAPKVIQPGDVNADGEINIKDAVILAQYLAGWDVQLGGDSHTVVIDKAVEPTCKSTGLTEGKHCSECGMVLVKQQVIPTTDHDYEDTVIPPTENEKGYTLHKCKNCEYEYKDLYTNVTLANGLEYIIENGECTIIGIGSCEETEINIPEKIENCTVTAIADKAFSEQKQITKLNLPSTVKSFGQRAFYGCTGLTEFTVPASVTSVGHQIFYKCDNLATVYYNSNYSPEKDMVFLNYSSIKNVVFGGEAVPAAICYNSLNIQNIEILDSVKILSEEAFYGCKNLKKVTIGIGVTNIGHQAFRNCTNLESVLIGNGVKTIGYGAFYNCTSLSQIVIPDGVIKIVDWAFGYCEGFVSVEISESITNIGSNAFYHCSKLNNVEIPNSVVSIGSDAFSWCISLECVTIGNSVANIGNGAFQYCSNLTTVYYVGDSNSWNNIDIGGETPKLKSAERYYYSATEPTESGNYWHYVDGKPTPW